MVDVLAGDKYRRSPTAAINRYSVFVAKYGGVGKEQSSAVAVKPQEPSPCPQRKPRRPPLASMFFMNLHSDAKRVQALCSTKS